MIEERVTAYFETSQDLPDNILFYRDGVSESQFGMVRSEELHQIEKGAQKAFKALQSRTSKEQWKPNVTLLVAVKRHHARFFPSIDIPTRAQDQIKKDPRDGPRLDPNVGPGLVVDTDIIKPDQFSFYVQSHHSPLGTAKSTHYVVIHDDYGYKPSHLQIVVSSAFSNEP